MERAVAHNATMGDMEALKQGFALVHQKFSSILMAQGVQAHALQGRSFRPRVP